MLITQEEAALGPIRPRLFAERMPFGALEVRRSDIAGQPGDERRPRQEDRENAD